MHKIYFLPCWVLLSFFSKELFFSQCWDSFIFVLIRCLHSNNALSHTGTWSQERKSWAFVHKADTGDSPASQSRDSELFLRNREIAHPASSGLRNSFMTDHLEEDIFITDIIGCTRNHISNLALVTFIIQMSALSLPSYDGEKSLIVNWQ